MLIVQRQAFECKMVEATLRSKRKFRTGLNQLRDDRTGANRCCRAWRGRLWSARPTLECLRRRFQPSGAFCRRSERRSAGRVPVIANDVIEIVIVAEVADELLRRHDIRHNRRRRAADPAIAADRVHVSQRPIRRDDGDDSTVCVGMTRGTGAPRREAAIYLLIAAGRLDVDGGFGTSR